MNPAVNPASRRLRRFVLLFVVASLSGALAGCRERGTAEGAATYFCPMHPEVVSDRPGTCPICHMDLVRRDDGGGAPRATAPASAPAAKAGEILFYRHPMRPEVTSPVPAKDEMGMDYVPVRAGEGAGAGKETASPGAGVSRLAAIAAVEARAERVARTVRTVGRVVADERRTTRVESRFSGWIASLDADFTGFRVRRGQRLATLDSPELYAAESEYLVAREAARRFLASNLPEVRRGGDDLVLAARRRLELLNLPAARLAELERTRVPRRALEIAAPADGVVTEKMVVRGQRVEPGMSLFTLVDLSSIWIEADLYEADAAFARVGRRASIGSPYDPALRLEAQASYVFPALDPQSRTLRVRFDAPNPGEALKPGMFVDVEVELGELAGVAIPDAAVLATGERTLVFVVDGGGYLPREVRLAGRHEGRTFVREGLEAGERVAAEAAFLLDADARLRSAIGGVAPTAAPADPHAAHRGGTVPPANPEPRP